MTNVDDIEVEMSDAAENDGDQFDELGGSGKPALDGRKQNGRIESDGDEEGGIERVGTPPEGAAEGSNRPDALSEDEVLLALQNVQQLFPGSPGIESPKHQVEPVGSPLHRQMGAPPSKDSIAKIRRNRVDSSARPPEFFKPKKGKMTVPIKREKTKVDYDNLKNHGVKCTELRERLESKAIDYDTVDKVLGQFEKHDKISPDEFESLQGMVEQAHQLHRDNDLVGAEKLYNEVLVADPLDWDCLCNLAKICFGMGNYVQAKELFERAIVVRPEREKTMYYLAQVLYNLSEFDRSKLLFEQVVQGYNGEITGDACDIGTYHNSIAMLGLIQQQVLKKLETAEQMYAVVLKEDPKHVLALDHRCALKHLQGKKAEAAKEHIQVLELDPGHAKKLCPYLDCLFPSDSEMLHPIKDMQERLDVCTDMFAEGAKKRGFLKASLHGLAKKFRSVLKGNPKS